MAQGIAIDHIAPDTSATLQTYSFVAMSGPAFSRTITFAALIPMSAAGSPYFGISQSMTVSDGLTGSVPASRIFIGRKSNATSV
ncbi:uncharacterized protein RCC_12287 [Ramularia collo-cygni]|uniref:Uncharacterized protein n=1 Tax=Ramularia collo-cygni TaxID=112498 RepID=A0A2D3V0P8_9PEZI|nr:uncharacterized protein RCC_12287 [Ramularia collo-cygni]CZT15079.1 uncharacterized protein RCC_12287 [Ramularia collo-cygni]